MRLNHPTGRLSYQNIYDAVRATGVKLDSQVRKDLKPSFALFTYKY